ncbi:DNA polymerase III subunit delta [Buchnera aphidicola (Mollitrichosiphum nigrofasciatum)]|uniref:DNA polymerase III subunit delta n=1 Tax=Buchnera aphidicola TaxID=9 RepID=UPI0031B7F425
MNIISPEDIKKSIQKKKILTYLITGNEISLRHYSKKKILKYSKKKKFNIKETIYIEHKKDWNKVFLFFLQKNIFFKKTILEINTLNEKKDNVIIFENIKKILNFEKKNVLLIINIKKTISTQNLKYNINKIYHKRRYLIIDCFKNKLNTEKKWLYKKIKELKLNISKSGIKILSNAYKNNLLEIFKILDFIALIWPNKLIRKKNISKIILESPKFDIKYLIYNIFLGKIKKSIKILNNLKKKIENPIIITRKIQKNIIKIIKIKTLILQKNAKYVNKINKISSKKKKKMFLYVLKTHSIKKLYKIINLLTKIEINIKKKYNKKIWFPLKILIFMFY